MFADHTNYRVPVYFRPHRRDLLTLGAICFWIAAFFALGPHEDGRISSTLGKALPPWFTVIWICTLCWLIYGLPPMVYVRRNRYHPGVHPVAQILLAAFFGTVCVALVRHSTDVRSGLSCFFMTLFILILSLSFGFNENFGAYKCFMGATVGCFHSIMSQEHLGFNIYLRLFGSSAFLMGIKAAAYYYFFKDVPEYININANRG